LLIFITVPNVLCWKLCVEHLIIYREDFDHVDASSLLNSLDTDNLTLGAEGKILKILTVPKYSLTFLPNKI